MRGVWLATGYSDDLKPFVEQRLKHLPANKTSRARNKNPIGHRMYNSLLCAALRDTSPTLHVRGEG